MGSVTERAGLENEDERALEDVCVTRPQDYVGVRNYMVKIVSLPIGLGYVYIHHY